MSEITAPWPGPDAAAKISSFYLLNLGCAKNLVEGEHISGLLQEQGLKAQGEPDAADLLLVNTCGFLQPAVEEAIAAILDLQSRRRPGQYLVVLGCLVGRYGKKLARSLPEVDLFLGPSHLKHLWSILNQPHPPAQRLALQRPSDIFTSQHARIVSTGPGWAYLRIADGCDHKCAYCAIPHIRGPLRSRALADLKAEARALAVKGNGELNLIAQDTAAYGQDLGLNDGLYALLNEIAAINEVHWIRLLYLHPDNLGSKLISRLSQVPKLLPYFDLPLQHISDPVLKLMRRVKNSAQLKELLQEIRGRFSQAVLRTSLIVGHPGEGEKEFTELLEFVLEQKFNHLGCFIFHAEAGTASSRLGAAPAKTAAARQKKIMSAQKQISRQNQKQLVGTVQPVLVLGPHPQSELLGQGRLWSQAPEADGEAIIVDGSGQAGRISRARVLKAHAYDFEVELLPQDE